MKTLVCIASILLLHSVASAQMSIDQKDSVYFKHLLQPHLNMGMGFMSDEVYNGRRIDSTGQWGLHPSLTLFLPKGWNIDAQGNIWSAYRPAYALTSVGVNKVFEGESAWYASFGYYRWMYSNRQDQKTASFDQHVEGDVSFDFGGLSADVFSMVMFGKQTASLIAPSLNWEKSWWQKDRRYSITGTLLSTFGNDDARMVPVTTTSLARLRRIQLAQTSKTSDPGGFGVLDYEASCNLTMCKKNHSLSLLTTLAKPVRSTQVVPTLLPVVTITYSHDIFLKNQGHAKS